MQLNILISEQPSKNLCRVILLYTALVQLHLKHKAQLWAPQYERHRMIRECLKQGYKDREEFGGPDV